MSLTLKIAIALLNTVGNQINRVQKHLGKHDTTILQQLYSRYRVVLEEKYKKFFREGITDTID